LLDDSLTCLGTLNLSLVPELVAYWWSITNRLNIMKPVALRERPTGIVFLRAMISTEWEPLLRNICRMVFKGMLDMGEAHHN